MRRDRITSAYPRLKNRFPVRPKNSKAACCKPATVRGLNATMPHLSRLCDSQNSLKGSSPRPKSISQRFSVSRVCRSMYWVRRDPGESCFWSSRCASLKIVACLPATIQIWAATGWSSTHKIPRRNTPAPAAACIKPSVNAGWGSGRFGAASSSLSGANLLSFRKLV